SRTPPPPTSTLFPYTTLFRSRPKEIVDHPAVREVLDWSRPIGVLAIAMFHFVPQDAEATHILQVLRDAMPSGSYLALSHASADRSEEHTSELQSLTNLVCRLL